MSNQLKILKEQLAKLESTSTEKIKEIKEKIEAIKEKEKEYQKKYYLETRKQKRKEQREQEKKEPLILKCQICGKEFVAKHKNARFCSDECREKYSNEYQKNYRKSDTFKAKLKKYRESVAYKKARSKYAKSKKGKEALKRYFQRYKENGYKALSSTESENK